MRLFFALPLPQDARGVLGGWMKNHQELRWTPLENLHLTLAFLGEVGEEGAVGAAECGATVAARHGVLPLATAGLGSFRRAHGAQVVFLELAPNPALQGLVEDLRRALAAAAIAFDPKPFHPHLTLARPKVRQPLPAAPAPMAWTAGRLHLMESRLEADGAKYEVRDSWRLTAVPSEK